MARRRTFYYVDQEELYNLIITNDVVGQISLHLRERHRELGRWVYLAEDHIG